MTPIGLREQTEILALIRNYRMTDTDPHLAVMLRAINFANPRSIDLKVWQVIKARVLDQHTTLSDQPFLTSAVQQQRGEFTVAHQKSDGLPITIGREGLSRHTLVISTTGGGKSTFVHNLLDQTLNARIPAWILDPKDDAKYLAASDPNFLVFHSHAPYTPLQVPPYVCRAEHIAAFITCFAKAFYGAEHTKQVLNEALHKIYADRDQPSIEDLKHTVDSMYSKIDTYSRRDAIRGVSLRLQRIQDLYPGIFTARRGISMQELVRHSLYFPIMNQTEVDEFFFTFLVHQLFFHNRSHNVRNELTHLVVMDEGLLSWSTHQNKIEGTPLLSSLHSMVREFSIGMIVTTTSIQLTDKLLRSNSHLQVAMSLTDSNEAAEIARTFALSPEQRQYLDKKLCRGEAIIRLGAGWREPILATFPPRTQTKTVAPEVWEAAKQRINSLIPPPSPQVTLQSLTSDPKTSPKPVALTKTEEALLRSIIDRISPATEHYQRLHLHPQTGNRIKKKLLMLGLIATQSIVCRPGRGGAAIALLPTTLGYERLQQKPRHGTRGGDSIQHQYLVQELACSIPDSVIEAKLGTKSVDVLFRYNTTTHGELHNALAFLTSPSQREFLTALSPNALCALEVEVSDPVRTGVANSTRNDEAGIAFTILAVMPHTLTRTIHGVHQQPHEPHQSHAVIVDALALLQRLKTKRGGTTQP